MNIDDKIGKLFKLKYPSKYEWFITDDNLIRTDVEYYDISLLNLLTEKTSFMFLEKELVYNKFVQIYDYYFLIGNKIVRAKQPEMFFGDLMELK